MSKPGKHVTLAALAAFFVLGIGSAVAVTGGSSAAPSCEPSVSEALLSARIVGNSKSYRTDNPAEYAKVRAYLDGGARPSTSGMTHMGLHLVYLEDTCRAPDVTTTTTITTTTTPPPPPPPPPPGQAPFPSRMHVSNGVLVDENNYDLGVLKGFNVHVHPQEDESSFVWGQDHYNAMAAIGAKIQRVTLHWDSFQPNNGTSVSPAAIADLDTAIARAGNVSMYTTLEIHLNVNRMPGWVPGGCWEPDCFKAHGRFFTEYLATRYKDDKRVSGLNWNETPYVPTASLLSFFQTVVPWYRNIAPAWPLWVHPTAYGQGTPYPRNGLNASISAYLALDTNNVGIVSEYHDYLINCNTSSTDGYQFNGAIDPDYQISGGSNYGVASYPDTATSRAHLANHVAPWKQWADTGNGRVATAVGEWSYTQATKKVEYARDKINAFRGSGASVEIWWNYDTTTNTGVNPFAARPGGTWRPEVQAWFSNATPRA